VNERDETGAVILATIATFIFRFELILFFGPLFILNFGIGKKPIAIGFLTLFISLGKKLFFNPIFNLILSNFCAN
jgi:hypothetical protein